uniref:Reverse transcriptase zinc-binding domain-containing protein n=1 Tax=Fagus sylvatica TaxID=28930 RepID=A0A2N9ISR7_FAGSY
MLAQAKSSDDSLLFCQASLANGEALINILQLYEEASGQQLNRAKTSLYFTKNTPSAMRELIKDLFQVPEIKCHDKYLGLPSFVGRSKKEAFGGLKDRVWRRIFGWKEKLLSKAGREILIKAVAQSYSHAKYFPSCSFMDARVGRRPSYAWRSLAMGRSVLNVVMRWHGQKIRIWHDPWLPLVGSCMVQSMSAGMNPKATVSDLLLEEPRRWNETLVRENFSEWEAGVIMSIQLRDNRRGDRLFWNETKTGVFSVRSAYHLQLRHVAEVCGGESSTRHKDRGFWKFVWALSIPPKVKSFIWRACIGILPTNDLKFKRHMRGDGCCPVCVGATESAEHVLWMCPMANDVWVASTLPVLKWDRLVHSFCDLIVMARSRLGRGDLEFFACLMYFIWHQQNGVVYDGRVSNPVMVVERGRRLIQGFRDAHALPEVVLGRGNRRTVEEGSWTPPLPGLYKLNWDVHVDKETQAGWVGILIRDSAGLVMAAICASLPFSSRGEYFWYSGALVATQFALELGFFYILFEGSCSVFLSKLCRQVRGETIQDMWLKDIWALIPKFRSWEVLSVSRDQNIAAVCLAKLGSKFRQTTVWLENYPAELRNVLESL